MLTSPVAARSARSGLAFSLLLSAACALAPAARAQAFNPIKFGVAGGAAFPTGDLADVANIGLTGQAMLGISFPTYPVGLRLDVAYTRMGIDFGEFEDLCGELGATCDFSGNFNVISGTLNGIVVIPTTSVIRPYLVAGGGIFRQKASVDGDFSGIEARRALRTARARRAAAGLATQGVRPQSQTTGDEDPFSGASETETRPGVNVGLGIQFPVGRRSAFLEARLVNIFNKKDDDGSGGSLRYIPITIGFMF
ncbi:MAG: hypothetical protein WKG32_15435 [Gemmatimonadaceae bacterium]